MNKIFVILLIVTLSIFSLTVLASSNKPKPGQKSTTCYFNAGPKVGQTEDLAGKAEPALIGRSCADSEGNSGIAVLSKQDEEAEEAEEAADAARVRAARAAAYAEKMRQKSASPAENSGN